MKDKDPEIHVKEEHKNGPITTVGEHSEHPQDSSLKDDHHENHHKEEKERGVRFQKDHDHNDANKVQTNKDSSHPPPPPEEEDIPLPTQLFMGYAITGESNKRNQGKNTPNAIIRDDPKTINHEHKDAAHTHHQEDSSHPRNDHKDAGHTGHGHVIREEPRHRNDNQGHTHRQDLHSRNTTNDPGHGHTVTRSPYKQKGCRNRCRFKCTTCCRAFFCCDCGCCCCCPDGCKCGCGCKCCQPEMDGCPESCACCLVLFFFVSLVLLFLDLYLLIQYFLDKGSSLYIQIMMGISLTSAIYLLSFIKVSYSLIIYKVCTENSRIWVTIFFIINLILELTAFIMTLVCKSFCVGFDAPVPPSVPLGPGQGQRESRTVQYTTYSAGAKIVILLLSFHFYYCYISNFLQAIDDVKEVRRSINKGRISKVKVHPQGEEEPLPSNVHLFYWKF